MSEICGIRIQTANLHEPVCNRAPEATQRRGEGVTAQVPPARLPQSHMIPVYAPQSNATLLAAFLRKWGAMARISREQQAKGEAAFLRDRNITPATFRSIAGENLPADTAALLEEAS